MSETKFNEGLDLMKTVEAMSTEEAKARLTALLYGMSTVYVSKTMAIRLAGSRKNFERIEATVEQKAKKDGRNTAYQYRAKDLMLKANVG